MNEIYLKRGEAVRLVIARGVRTLASSLERGAAGTREGRFFSASLAPDLPWTLPVEPAEAIEDQIRGMIPRGLTLERLEILLGTSHHVLGQKQWSEAHARVFLASVDPSRGRRLEILRGGATPAELDLAGIAASLRTWSRPGPLSEDAAVELRPAVSAAVAAFFASSGRIPEALSLVQEPHPSFPLDGNGERVTRFEAAGSSRDEWPNCERPSYRTPPRPSLLHARLEGSAAADDAPSLRALEPLGAVRKSKGGVELIALMESESGSFPATLSIPMGALESAKRRDGAIRWFPVGSGAWGETLVLEPVTVGPAR